MSTEGDNNIPAKAILYALIFSLTSVAVSIYQETLFKVQIEKNYSYYQSLGRHIETYFCGSTTAGASDYIVVH